MDPFDQMRDAANLSRLQNEAALKASSLRRLQQILEKKLLTAFIAPVAQVEEHFGVLWGHKKAYQVDEMTPQERAWWQVFQQLRHQVLNNGNNQLRAVRAELGQYEVIWMRHTLRLSPKEEM